MKRLVHIAALLGAILVMVLEPLPALANPVPVPTACTVMPQDLFEHPRILGMPTTGSGLQAAVMTVTVLDSSGVPIPYAHVQMVFGSACAELCFCPGAVLEGYTNASGVVELVMALGGCCQDPTAATLLVWGMPIRIYDTVASPDLSSGTGGGDCSVSLLDFSTFGGCFGSTGGGPCSCTDYNGDEMTGVGDLVVFGAAWGHSCP